MRPGGGGDGRGAVPGDVVWCIFRCPVPVRALDPAAAHDAMEDHYAAEHADDIAAMIRRLRW